MLPTPFGLVRYGVAPDHPEVKSVQNDFERVAENNRFRFFGNVTIGKEMSLGDLRARYDAVVLAMGAEGERSLGLEGEESLDGVMSARSFVSWYNGHPHFQSLEVDLNCERAVVVGQGNVAIDVARILCSNVDDLRKTDITDAALEALEDSSVKQVFVLGRRGPAQAAFTIKELRELTAMEGVSLHIDERDMKEGLNSASQEEIKQTRANKRKIELIQKVFDSSNDRKGSGASKQIHFRFLSTPVGLEASKEGSHVAGIRVARNRLEGEAGRQRAVVIPTGEDGAGEEIIPCGLVLQSIGYKSKPVPGLSFDDKRHIARNQLGRVVFGSGEVDPGLYVSGWLKRGPSGIIGSNIVDARQTVDCVLEDLKVAPPKPVPAMDLPELLSSKNVNFVDWATWKKIDAQEKANGVEQGRPRVKTTGTGWLDLLELGYIGALFAFL